MVDPAESVLARIAKHNGTSIEFEREQALRKKLGATDRDQFEDNRAGSVDGTSDGRAGDTVSRNPWRVAVVVLWAVTFAFGLILLSVGASDYAAFDGQSHRDPGLVQMLIGTSFLTIGVVGFTAWMVGEMVLWRSSGK